MQETLIWLSSPLALALSSNGSLPWKPHLAGLADETVQALAAVGSAEGRAAVERAARARLDRFLTGIERYRAHPYRRPLTDPPTLWAEGAARLLDYRAPTADSPHAAGPVVLAVPSLVNRAYILDLAPGRSFLRALAAGGLRPLLLDWGQPSGPARGFTLTDHIAGALDAAIEQAAELGEGRVILLGYCMGGLLALAGALRRRREVAGLALLATPWDFHAGAGADITRRRLAAGWPTLSLAVEQSGVLSTDLLQALFAGLDPRLVATKFMAIGGPRLPAPATLEAFVALEDWLNDGVPLAGPVAVEAIEGWYLENRPARGDWRVAGRRIDPGTLTCPTLVIAPQADRIVPPDSAQALAAAIPGATLWRPALGHIGMMAGGRAERMLWAPLIDWCRSSVM